MEVEKEHYRSHLSCLLKTLTTDASGQYTESPVITDAHSGEPETLYIFHMYIAAVEIRRRHHIPWNCCELPQACQDLNLCTLQKQNVVFKTNLYCL